MTKPTEIKINHTTDLYYQVVPVDGYIVIQNGSDNEELLSITKLRTTNLNAPAEQGGILGLTAKEAVTRARTFAAFVAKPAQLPQAPEVEILQPQQQADAITQLTKNLFSAVRQWLD